VISFVGAGPGAADLITMRGAARLAAADVVIWAASLVPAALLEHCGTAAEVHDSKTMTLEDVTGVYEQHPDAAIVRLHSGDPSVYSAIGEQIAWCVANHRAFEIVPGVSSVSAAAAAIGRELTAPAVTQSVVLTRLAHRTAASMPVTESVAGFARVGGTMAVLLSAARPDELQTELLTIGSTYRDTTPAVIASRVSWPDERIVHTTVGGLAEAMHALGATTTVVVLVGDALGLDEVGARSHVYAPDYAHSFRAERSTSDLRDV
jgi:precorrin-4/cobalt-precorrin-4 C11-methyltransferase